MLYRAVSKAVSLLPMGELLYAKLCKSHNCWRPLNRHKSRPAQPMETLLTAKKRLGGGLLASLGTGQFQPMCLFFEHSPPRQSRRAVADLSNDLYTALSTVSGDKGRMPLTLLFREGFTKRSAGNFFIDLFSNLDSKVVEGPTPNWSHVTLNVSHCSRACRRLTNVCLCDGGSLPARQGIPS